MTLPLKNSTLTQTQTEVKLNMSTHAILSYKEDNKYVAKYCQYGAIEDYYNSLTNAEACTIKQAVDEGDSSEPLDGSYLDESYCVNSLGWSRQTFYDEFNSHKPKRFNALGELQSYAEDEFASYIYVIDLSTNKFTAYSYNGHHWDTPMDLYADNEFFNKLGGTLSVSHNGDVDFKFMIPDEVDVDSMQSELEDEFEVTVAIVNKTMHLIGGYDEVHAAADCVEERWSK